MQLVESLQRPSPLCGGLGVALFSQGGNSGVHIVFAPIEAGADFHGAGKPPVFNVAIDGRSATAAEFDLKVAEGEESHDDAPMGFMNAIEAD
jgi:hypothetical protein